MIRVREAVIVEGKYDKIRLSNIIDGLIITTEGFGIFKNKEKQLLIRQLAEKRGILILTDSDGAGFVIRNFLKGAVPPSQVKHAYIPDIAGKERRKDKPSKEGKLGVEGVPDEIIARAIRASGAECTVSEGFVKAQQEISKTDLFVAGLSGGSCSSDRRAAIKKELGLPEKMTANSLLQVLNCLMTREEFFSLCERIFDREGEQDA